MKAFVTAKQPEKCKYQRWLHSPQGVYRKYYDEGSRKDTVKFVALHSNLNNFDFVIVMEFARRNGG